MKRTLVFSSVLAAVLFIAAPALAAGPDLPHNGRVLISIQGDPDIECSMAVGDPASATAGAMVATAMRIVNAVPYVCRAEPGIRTYLDLPLIAGRAAPALRRRDGS